MRYLIIQKSSYGLDPWVLAETPDEEWAGDMTLLNGYVVLSEDEAMLDPDYAPAAVAWKARDDSAFQADEAVWRAESTLDEATIEARELGLVPRPDRDLHEISPLRAIFSDAGDEVPAEDRVELRFGDFAMSVPRADEDPYRNYLMLSIATGAALEDVERNLGRQHAALIARVVGRELASHGHEQGAAR